MDVFRVQDAANAQEYVYKGGEIEFKNVTFGYTKDKPIMKDLSLTFPRGKWVSLVGESGLGKTTMLNLIVILTKNTSFLHIFLVNCF